MKKIYTVILMVFSSVLMGQNIVDSVTTGSNQFAISGNTYSFFQTVNARSWNRSIYIYPKQVIYRNRPTIQSGRSRLGRITLFRDVTRVSTVAPFPGRLQMGSHAKIWMANTDSLDFANITTWSAAQATFAPRLVMDKDIKAEADTSSGYKTFNFNISQMVIDTSKNLYIAVEYIQDSAAIDQVYWAYDATSVQPGATDTTNYYSSLQFRFSHIARSQTPLPVDGFTGSNIRHPHVRFVYLTNVATDELTPSVQNLTIFPNPARAGEPLTVKFQNPTTQNLEFVVTDLSGRTIFQKNAQILGGGVSETLETHLLPKGVFLLTIFDENGLFTTEKFIID